VYFGVEAARVTGARRIVAAVEAGGPEPPLTDGQMVAYSAANVDQGRPAPDPPAARRQTSARSSAPPLLVRAPLLATG
jgi:hypothetical protein